MSFLNKMFGGKSSSKPKSGKSSKHSSSNQNEYGFTPDEMAEAEKSLGVISNRKDRLSVSKSGRHKLKGRQRLNLNDETYASHGSVGAPSRPTASNISQNPSATNNNGHASSSSTSRGYASSSQGGQGSLGRNSQNGSLGRSTGGNCAVAQKSTDAKRYTSGQKGMPRQPTAV